MMTMLIRSLEFAFHCLDASPWPFTLQEILRKLRPVLLHSQLRF